MAGLASHRERADNYIGAANRGAQDDAKVQADLAKAEALLVVAEAIEGLAAAVRDAWGVPARA
jgi:hypothetical protein